MRDLDGNRHAVNQHDLVRPVELVGLAWRKAQRHISFGNCLAARRQPLPRVPPNRVIATGVPEPAQFLEDPDQRQPLAHRLRLVTQKHPVKIGAPRPQLRPRLHRPHVLKGGCSRTQNLAHRIARYLQLAHDLLDRLAFDKALAPDPGDRLHNQHPPATRSNPEAGQPAHHGAKGVKVRRRSPLHRGQSSTPEHNWAPTRYPWNTQ